MVYVIKCILIGKTGVGKTSLSLKYFNDKFLGFEDNVPTIGVDFHTKRLIIDDEHYKIQVWDTAGQERFNSIIKSYYNSANCVVFCFSLIDRASFTTLEKLMDDYDNHVNKPTSKILVGTFYDKKKLINIEQYEIDELMVKRNIKYYFNVSSLDGTGLNDLFDTVIKSSIALHKENIIQLKQYDVEQFTIIDSKKNSLKNCCIII